jgi:hypothetical protein
MGAKIIASNASGQQTASNRHQRRKIPIVVIVFLQDPATLAKVASVAGF